MTKALGCGLIQWNGVEVMRQPRRAPSVRIFGKIEKFADYVGVRQEEIFISITHSELLGGRRRHDTPRRVSVKLYSAQEMTRADEGAQELGISGTVLMERAGAAMARVMLERYAPSRALAVCGGGNNGGDGFVIARELHRAGVEVSVVATKDEYSGDPATNLEILRNIGVEVHGPEMLGGLLDGAGLVVDALLGNGILRDCAGERGRPDPATKRRRDDDGLGGRAERRGRLYGGSPRGGREGRPDGLRPRGQGRVRHLARPGVRRGSYRGGYRHPAGSRRGTLRKPGPTPRLSGGNVPRTAGPAHKYSAGALLVVAGSKGVTGAPVMVVEGAQATGCGIVFLATPESAGPDVDLRLTEALVYGTAEDASGQMDSDALEQILEQAERATRRPWSAPAWGPGAKARSSSRVSCGRWGRPVLLDADAISNLAGSDALSRREAPTMITPHPGELGRLMEIGTKELQGPKATFSPGSRREARLLRAAQGLRHDSR